MKLTFIGASHEVTGSATLIQTDKLNILVDYGMEQGYNMYENAPLPVNESEIDMVLLTHAHIDHSGNIPLLYKKGFRGKVYATRETCNLCEIMLMDSAHIQESEAEWKTRKAKRAGLPEVEAVYDSKDAEGVLTHFVPVEYNDEFVVNDSIKLRFTDIGHLLGSAAIEVWITEEGQSRKVVFSGDVGNINQPIINDPKAVSDADYVLIESTYGNRLHENMGKANAVNYLAQCIQDTLDRGGNVVIPSFAVGRTQEMLYFIREIKEKNMVTGHDGFKVYVDSPLSVKATEIFMDCSESCLDEESLKLVKQGINPIRFDGLVVAVATEESKAINYDTDAKVIISSSGMCQAGRIRHHLKHNLWREDSTILFVGYQSNGTLGRLIYDGLKEVKLFGERIAVKAKISLLPAVSGHADKAGLISWLNKFEHKPKMVFVNHGESSSCEDFANTLINDLGYNAYAPFSGTVFDLLKGEFIYKAEGVLRDTNAVKAPVVYAESAEYSAFRRSIDKLVEVSQKCKGFSNRLLKELTDSVNNIIKQIEK